MLIAGKSYNFSEETPLSQVEKSTSLHTGKLYTPLPNEKRHQDEDAIRFEVSLQLHSNFLYAHCPELRQTQCKQNKSPGARGRSVQRFPSLFFPPHPSSASLTSLILVEQHKHHWHPYLGAWTCYKLTQQDLLQDISLAGSRSILLRPFLPQGRKIKQELRKLTSQISLTPQHAWPQKIAAAVYISQLLSG